MTAAPGHAAILMGASQVASRERLFLATADLLAARGWRVDILSSRPVPALEAAVRPPVNLVDIGHIGPIRFPRATPILARLYGGVFAVASYLKRERPDVLMGTSIPPNLIALAARRLAKSSARIVIRQSNVVPVAADPASAGVARRPRDRLMPRLYPDAETAIAVSGGVADNLAAAGWLPPDRIAWIPNGVELDEVEAKAAEPAPHPWLARPDGAPVIVTVGRLIPKKDYPTLLEAFARLTAGRPARLIALGEGPERGRIAALAEKLGLQDRVDLAGHTVNPFAYLARADLFVLASRFEGMPSVVIEALACGCPAVSTDCPSGPAEILGDGAYGWLTPVGDVEALAAAMATALDAPRDPARLKARAAEFSAAETARRYAEVLEAAAAGAGSGRPSNSR